ncbi:retrovirus-related pol polyprotein from transposon TNT 1-94 [Tanacetum coccineum]
MRALLIQHGCEAAREVLPADMEAQTKAELNKKAHSAVILCLGNKVLREVTGETTAAGVWSKLETLYMTKSLANKLYLKKKLYTFYMPAERKIFEHIDDIIRTLCGYLAFRTGRFLKDVMATSNSKEIKERYKAKGDDGEGLYVRGRTDRRDSRQLRGKLRSKSRDGRLKCYICQSEDHLKRNCPKNNRKKSRGYVKKDDQPSSNGSTYDDSEVMMVMSAQALLDWIMDSGWSVRSEIYRKIAVGKVKVINGSRVVLSGIRRDNCVYSLDGHAVAGELNASVEEKDSLEQVQTRSIWKVQRVEAVSRESDWEDGYEIAVVKQINCFKLGLFVCRLNNENGCGECLASGHVRSYDSLTCKLASLTALPLSTNMGLTGRGHGFESRLGFCSLHLLPCPELFIAGWTMAGAKMAPGNGLLVVSGSGPAVTSNWAVCCTLNPPVLPPIPPEWEKDSGDGKQNTADMTQFVQTLLQQMQNRFQTILTPQLHESAGDLPSLKLSLHSCSLPGSTNAMGIETSIALVLPAREHECDTSFVLRRPPALSSVSVSGHDGILSRSVCISLVLPTFRMGERISELEQSINDLRAEMGAEGTPPPAAPKKEEGSA